MSPGQLRELLSTHLSRFRTQSYADLAERVESDRHNHDCLAHFEATAADGTEYQIEINALWDDRPGGDVRVIGSISAEPQRRLLGVLPIYVADATDSFIMNPNGEFVGEQ